MMMEELIGSGGMQDCYKVVILKCPPRCPVLAPDGWIAKFYEKMFPAMHTTCVERYAFNLACLNPVTMQRKY